MGRRRFAARAKGRPKKSTIRMVENQTGRRRREAAGELQCVGRFGVGWEEGRVGKSKSKSKSNANNGHSVGSKAQRSEAQRSSPIGVKVNVPEVPMYQPKYLAVGTHGRLVGTSICMCLPAQEGWEWPEGGAVLSATSRMVQVLRE